MYDAITAEQWIYGLTACLVVFGVLWWLWWRSERPHDMSTAEQAPAVSTRVENRSVDQSVPTGLHTQTRAAAPTGLLPPDDRGTADMDAASAGLDWQAPPVSRYLSDDEFIVFLASQRLPGGKYRLSANRIVQAAGGDRTHVLKIVREVREGVPEYLTPLTPEQAETRRELALD